MKNERRNTFLKGEKESDIGTQFLKKVCSGCGKSINSSEATDTIEGEEKVY